ncbi:hypothetical protein [Halorussus lipolyticus]|uniref:hypothetical protein n=1 Tax=Halorussus lipolyticus TaxID=3034024 RepID=UPI0023E79B99|nr:hypothetical protein [Halorussus sp. DT80]
MTVPTFVERVQSVATDNPTELGRVVGERVETLGEALELLEDWTEESRETRTELASKYESAKDLARDEIRDASDDDDRDPDDIPTEDLLDHPAVSDHTKQRLAEYSTKLYVYLDEESAYGEARTELARALDAELELYADLLPALESGTISVRDAQQQIARLGREQNLGPPNQTAADVLLESGTKNRE